jgi:hypothetical protein
MAGFVYGCHAFYTADQEVIAYSSDQLPVLYGQPSRSWFASVPTQTDANRAFSLCGTSLGGLTNGTPPTYNARHFNVLVAHRSSGITGQYHGLGAVDA